MGVAVIESTQSQYAWIRWRPQRRSSIGWQSSTATTHSNALYFLALWVPPSIESRSCADYFSNWAIRSHARISRPKYSQEKLRLRHFIRNRSSCQTKPMMALVNYFAAPWKGATGHPARRRREMSENVTHTGRHMGCIRERRDEASHTGRAPRSFRQTIADMSA